MESRPHVAVGANIWVRDTVGEDIWVRGEVLDGGAKVLLTDSMREINLPQEFLICNDDIGNVDDLTQLTHLHEASLLDALHKRFDIDSIYTYTGPILIAVNPFKRIAGLYDQDVLEDFIRHTQDVTYLQSERVPHVFAVALEAYRGLCELQKNQTVLISGESGAGKTESTKFVMKLLALAGTQQKEAAATGARPTSSKKMVSRIMSTHEDGSTLISNMCETTGNPAVTTAAPPSGANSSVENQVLQSNPLLEAFGNAKTLRNDNSSRFGKFIEMEFEVEYNLGKLVGAKIHTYLLETVRVCRQLLNERNFHAFYQLAAAVSEQGEDGLVTIPPSVVTQFGGHLETPLTYDFSHFSELLTNRYVSCSGCVEIEHLDEFEEFQKTCVAMSTVKISLEEQRQMWNLVGTILLLGSIYFYSANSQSENCVVDDSMRETLKRTSELLGVKEEDLEKCLTSRTIIVQKEKYTKGLTLDQAEDARDALARALYHTLFRRIVSATNTSIRSGDKTAAGKTAAAVSCGVLDIFGFECFDVNSFEQLCINFTNERLQSFFNHYIFSCEEKLYRAEDIKWDTLDFPDNTDCVELIGGGSNANSGLCVLSLLDEECVIPKGNDQNLCNKYKSNFKGHKRFGEIKTRQDWFVVNHFAGDVNYCIKGFIDKNKDQLGQDIQDCIKTSSNAFIKDLFDTYLERGAAAAGAPASAAGQRVLTKKKPLTVSLEFRNQLTSLMDTISKTEPHFVRCVKPNPLNRPDIFNRKAVAEQLRYAGVLQAVQVSRAGYPVRDTHSQFWTLYRCLLSKVDRLRLTEKYKDNYEPGSATTSSDAQSPLRQFNLPSRERALEALQILNEQYSIPSSKHSDGTSWAVGKTLVFLKHEAYEVLSTKRAERRNQAAKLIQAQWLGVRTRRWYSAAMSAIVTIQCAVRCSQAKSTLMGFKQKQAAHYINRVARGFLVRQQMRRKHKAATSIQRIIRGRQTRAYVKDLKRHRAAARIQSYVRRHLQLKWYRRVMASIIAIQLRWKRYVAQRKLATFRLEARSASTLQLKINELQRQVQELRQENAELKALAGESKKVLVEEGVMTSGEKSYGDDDGPSLGRQELTTTTGESESFPISTSVPSPHVSPSPPKSSLVQEASPANSSPRGADFIVVPAADSSPQQTMQSPTQVASPAQQSYSSPARSPVIASSPQASSPQPAAAAAAESPVKVASPLASPSPSPASPLDDQFESPFGKGGAESDSAPDQDPAMAASTRENTPMPEEWAEEREKLISEINKLRDDLHEARDAIDLKAAGCEDYLECVLNVLSSPVASSPTAAEQPSLLCDVVFVSSDDAQLAQLLLQNLRSQLSWDEVNIERLNCMIDSVPISRKQIEFLFPCISMTSLKTAIISPTELLALLKASQNNRVLKYLRAAVFFPNLDGVMIYAWKALGLRVNRILLANDPRLYSVCGETFGAMSDPRELPTLLEKLCAIANMNRVNLVRDLQELKDSFKTKASLTKSKSMKPSPVAELMSLIPAMFTGGSMRTGNKISLPSQKSSNAVVPILEPTLAPTAGAKPTSISAWHDLRVPNGAAVTCVVFAPLEWTRNFQLLCAATKSGLIYTYKVPLTPLERDKVEKMNLPAHEPPAESDWAQAPSAIRLWKVLEGHERAITSMFFSKEGDYLITTSVDCSVRFWDYIQGFPAKIFSDSVPILVARIMPTNPKCFFTSNSKSVVRLVNSEEGQVIQRMKVDSEIRAVCFDSSGLNMIAGTKDGCIATYEVAEDTKIRFIDKINVSGGGSGRSAVTSVQFVRGNPPHIVVNLSDNHIVICAVYYGLTNCCVSQIVIKKRLKNPHSCLPLSTCLIRRDESSVCVSASEDNKLKVINSAADYEIVDELKGHICATLSVGCSPNKSLLASADVSGFIKLWRS